MDELSTPYSLSEDAVSRYRDEGFVKLKAVLSAITIDAFRAELTRVVRDVYLAQVHARLAEDYGTKFADKAAKFFAAPAAGPQSTYARAFTQRPNLWRFSPLAETLVRSTRLARIATQLMDVTGVRLYHDQALFKEAHGGHTPWHVDQFYWPLSNANTTTLWIPLQAVPLQMGPVAFARGSHRAAAQGLAAQLAISDESEARLAQLMSEFEVDESAFDIGDVSFHSGWTCHRAGPNSTDATRAAFTIIYMDENIRLIEPEHDNHRFDARMWLPGVRPGEIAASKLNPVLYSN